MPLVSVTEVVSVISCMNSRNFTGKINRVHFFCVCYHKLILHVMCQFKCFKQLNGRRGWVVSTPVSYSGSSGFKSQPADLLSRPRFFVIFLSPSRQILGLLLKIRPRLPPFTSFPIHYSSIVYSFSTLTVDEGEWSASRSGRALSPGKGPPVPIVQEAGWASEPIWTQRLEEKSSASVGDGISI
jgi:hypothetical protein